MQSCSLAIVWTEEYRVGVEAIDREHAALFDYVNLLLERDQDPDEDAPGSARDAIARLEQMFLEHFTNEENLMQACGFPGYESHKARHEEFLGILHRFTSFHPATGGFDGFFVGVFRNWILYHITVNDREIGLYLARQKAAPLPSDP